MPKKKSKICSCDLDWIKENFWNVLLIIIIWEIFKGIIALIAYFLR